MPLVINSAPDCVTHNEGAMPADDINDFILQANYQDEGTGAETAYMVLTWLGIVVTIAVLVAWVIYENRQFIRHMARGGIPPLPPDSGPPPQPGGREPAL